MWSSLLPFSLLALVVSVQAQGQVPAVATPAALALVDAQYVASGLNTKTRTGFGIELQSKALLSVVYPTFTVQNGQPYTAAQVAQLPTVYITPAAGALTTFTQTTKYTLVLADAASLGDPDLTAPTEGGDYRHFLANSLVGAPATGGNSTFVTSGGNVVTAYAGPGPLVGTGPHRYSWLLFAQAGNFVAPNGLNAMTPPSHWNVSTYAATPGLSLIAASFFTVENGTPTGPVIATQAVNTATLVVSSAVASSAAPAPSSSSAAASSSSGAASSSSSAAAAASTVKSGAAGRTVGPIGAAVALMGAVGLLGGW